MCSVCVDCVSFQMNCLPNRNWCKHEKINESFESGLCTAAVIITDSNAAVLNVLGEKSIENLYGLHCHEKTKVKRLCVKRWRRCTFRCIFKVATMIWKSRAYSTFAVALAFFLSSAFSSSSFIFCSFLFSFFVLRSTHVLSVLHEKRTLLWTAERNFS